MLKKDFEDNDLEKKRKKEDQRGDKREGKRSRNEEVPAAAEVQTSRWRCQMLR